MYTLARRSASLTIPALLTLAVSMARAQEAAPTTDMATPSATTAPATQPEAASADATTMPSATTPDSANTTTMPGETITVPRHSEVSKSKRVAFNFQDASIDSILSYLSDALDFVIVKDNPVNGRVTISSKQPVSADEAVDALNTVLKPQGFTALQSGRVLHIVSLEKGRLNAPVFVGADPKAIRPGDQIITQIIPVGSVDATKLKNDLQPLINGDAQIAANAGSNTIVVTDTASNVRRLVEIVAALDQHKESVSNIKTYKLKYADATAAATLINNTFKQDTTTTGNTQGGGFGRGGGFGGFFGGGGFGGGGGGGGGRGGNGGGGQGGGNASSDEANIGGKINAQADARTNTVVVTGPVSTLLLVDDIIKTIDNDPDTDTSFFIYNLKNAQAIDLEPVINTLFGNATSGSSGTSSSSSRTTGTSSSSSSGFGSLGGSSSGRSSSSLGSSFGGSSSTGSTNRSTGTGSTGSRSSSNNTSGAAAALAGQVFVVANSDTNSLLVTTTTKYSAQIHKILDELDRPVPQVLIKVLIAEVTHTDSDDIGLEFSALNQRVGGYGTEAGTDFGIASDVASGNVTGGLVIGILEHNASMTLRALASNNKLDVLSRPYILTSDNQEASMIVGQEIPIISNTQITDTGQTINTVTYQQVGIILDVTPHINPDGMVTLDVAPQVSQEDTGNGVQITAGITNPVFDIRAASSRVGIEDGRTIVIGGLMQDQKSQTVQKFPILGDIPYVGMLFKRTTNTKVKTELLIFLTPHVARRPSMLPGMSADEERGLKIVPNSVSPGTFQEHLRGMERGGNNPRPDVAAPVEPGTK